MAHQLPADEDRPAPGAAGVPPALTFAETKRIRSQGVLNFTQRLIPLSKRGTRKLLWAAVVASAPACRESRQ